MIGYLTVPLISYEFDSNYYYSTSFTIILKM